MNKNNLKSTLVYLSFISIGLVSCGNTENPVENVNNKNALEEIRKDPNVVEAIVTEANVIYIGVADNNKNKNYWAETFCSILKKHNATSSKIKVVQSGTTESPDRDNSYGILLGEADCK